MSRVPGYYASLTAHKRARVAFPCRVCSRECLYEEQCIQCDGCEAWIHARCISMASSQYELYSTHGNYQFFCRMCYMNAAGHVNFQACLLRIAACAPDVSRMQQQAESEHQLLAFYGSVLPNVVSPDLNALIVDTTAARLLSDRYKWLLAQFMPVAVDADGNCLFRSIALAVYGRQSLHVQLRLLASVEVLLHRDFYDTASADFYAPYRSDEELVLPSYGEFVCELVRDSSYSDMLTVLSLSSVVQKPLQTRWPLDTRDGDRASPFTKLVTGRDVTTMLAVNVLWSTCDSEYTRPTINHFVPLIPLPASDDVDGTAAQQQHAAEQNVSSAAVTGDNDSFSVADDVPVPPAEHGQRLNREFLPTCVCFKILSGMVPAEAVDSVPTGLKENVWFVVKRHGVDECFFRDKFWDDCGAWTKHHGTKSHHLQGSLSEVRLLPDGVFATRHRVEGKLVLQRMDPQPSDVLCMHRVYTRLSRDLTFQRRITYVDNCDYFIAEYLGRFPTHVEAHGNASKSAAEFVRARPEVLADLASTCAATPEKPRKVYQTKQLSGDDDTWRPRNMKQVQNVAARVGHGDRPKSSCNLADEIQTLLSCLTRDEEDFVQAVQCLLHRTPSVVLFTQQQISDIRNFCCKDAPDHLRTVFAVDRTFNLSCMYVTVTVFRHRKVVRKSTQQAPIFLGPMMLHNDGKFSTYLNFFSVLCGALNGSSLSAAEVRMFDNMISGSDEELALVSALRTAFPQSQHMYCMQHCRENVRHHLTTVGTPSAIREHVLQLLFACGGVAESADDQQLDNRTAQLMQYVRLNNVDAVDYLQQRTLPKLSNNCRLKWEQPWLGREQWTNNNCESANHLLKMQVDWRPARLTDLVDHLRALIRQQYAELQRSLCGLGDFQLAPPFAHHTVSQMRWAAMTAEARARVVARLTSDTGVRHARSRPTVTSTDAQLTVNGSPRVARKKGQGRRPRAERTTPRKL